MPQNQKKQEVYRDWDFTPDYSRFEYTKENWYRQVKSAYTDDKETEEW